MNWHHIKDTKPKAQKYYCCDLCGQGIPSGTVHIARAGVIPREGHITVRMHIDCEAIPRLHHWDDGDWECSDTSDFRYVINARVPANQTTTTP